MRKTDADTVESMSLPMRGEWIEINIDILLDEYNKSLPMRGEWIEISARLHENEAVLSLSPCGESGLKCKCYRVL